MFSNSLDASICCPNAFCTFLKFLSVSFLANSLNAISTPSLLLLNLSRALVNICAFLASKNPLIPPIMAPPIPPIKAPTGPAI